MSGVSAIVSVRALSLGLVAALALAFPAAAAPAVSMTVIVGVQGDYTATQGQAAQDAKLNFLKQQPFTTGSGINQAGKVYSESVNIAASSSESDDLTTVLDSLGATLALTAVKTVEVCADTTNTNSIVVGNAASNGWTAPFDAVTDTVSVPPGGCLVLVNPTAAGWTVDSSHKVLKVANSSSGTAVTGKLFIIGE